MDRSVRALLEADSSVTCLPGDACLDGPALLDVLDRAFAAVGDELDRVHIRRHDQRKSTVSKAKAWDALRADPNFASIWAIPRSERGQQRSQWLSAGMVFNDVPSQRTVFFGVPRRRQRTPCEAHLELWKGLCGSLSPTYGFVMHRIYGLGPDYFAAGISLNSVQYGASKADINLADTWSAERSGNPSTHPNNFRHERGMLLDVFPCNLLSTLHIEQRVGSLDLKSWIEGFAGTESFVAIDPGHLAWSVSPDQIHVARAELDRAGLLIPTLGSRGRRH